MSHRENKYKARRLTGTYISSIVSISLVLVLIGLGSLLLFDAHNVSDFFKEKLRISVLLSQDITEDEGRQFAVDLEAEPYVADAVFIGKHQGIEEMKEVLGEDFTEAFDSVPIPISVDVYLQAEYVVADSLAVVDSLLADYPIVDEVVCESSQIETITTNLAKIYLILGILIAILLFISVILISNMERLNLYIKRYTVNTMQLVGASHGFIMRPYLKKAAVQGVISSVIAMVVILAGVFVVKESVPQLFTVMAPSIVPVLLVVLVSGLLICVVSTRIVMGRLLSMDKDELYG